MATVKTTEDKKIEKTTEPTEKMVKIKLFKDNGKYSAPVFVGFNGRTWLIERGVEVEVPECVAEVLEQSAQADQEAMAFLQKISE